LALTVSVVTAATLEGEGVKDTEQREGMGREERSSFNRSVD
jgi:hypothetical protein